MALLWKQFFKQQKQRTRFLKTNLVVTFGAIATLGRLIDIHGKNASLDIDDIERFVLKESDKELLRLEVPREEHYRQLFNSLYYPIKYSMNQTEANKANYIDNAKEINKYDYNSFNKGNDEYIIERKECIDSVTNELLKMRMKPQTTESKTVYYISGEHGIGKTTLMQSSITNAKQVLNKGKSQIASFAHLKLEMPKDIDNNMLVNNVELRQRLFLDIILSNFSIYNYESIMEKLTMNIFYDIFCLVFRVCQIRNKLKCTLCIDISDSIYECLCENSIFYNQLQTFITDILFRLVKHTNIIVILMMDDKCANLVLNEMIPNSNMANEIEMAPFDLDFAQLCHNFNENEIKEYFDNNVKKVKFGPKYCDILNRITENGNVAKCSLLVDAMKHKMQSDWDKFAEYFQNKDSFEKWCKDELSKPLY